MVRVLEEVEKVSSSRCSAPSHRRRLSSADLDGYVADTTCNRRRNSFSYSRLPEHLLKLSILKLDGSCFDIQVGRSASVSELKLAVENVFSQSTKEGEDKISWSHVWGHFCLCYAGHKLIHDKASLRNFRIKDGDQLQFVRHVSINYIPPRGHPKSHRSESEQQIMSLATMKDQTLQGWQKNGNNDDNNAPHEIKGMHQDGSFDGNKDDDDLIQNAEFRLIHFLRGCLSYTRLLGIGTSRKARFGSYCQRIGARETRL